MEFIVRPYGPRDTRAVLRLNAACEAVLSPLDDRRLRLLSEMCSLHVVAAGSTGVIGFLMAFEDGTAYDSVNYRWFASRFKRFLYLDRMVVAPAFRRAGVGRALHAAAEDFAQAKGLAWIVGEIDLEPPNVVSLSYHDRLGFVEVGRQVLPCGKVVSMRARSIGELHP